MLTGRFTPIREDLYISLEFVATDAKGTKFAFSIPLTNNEGMKRVQVITWEDEGVPYVDSAMLAEVRTKASAWVETHQAELAAMGPKR